jgi:hypothetical protein
MASDEPRWTEPPGKAVDGQCKFQRVLGQRSLARRRRGKAGKRRGSGHGESDAGCNGVRGRPAVGSARTGALARPPRSERGLQASSVTARTAVMVASGKPVGEQRVHCKSAALRSAGRCSTTRQRPVLQCAQH